jgi:hypothetical protein
VPHGVGDGDVEVLTVDGVVEGVTPDIVGRLEPPGQGEDVGLHGVRRWQEPPLDLRGEGERAIALRPLEQVGVATRGDQDVGESVCRRVEVVDHVTVRLAGQRELEDADGVAPAR